MLICNNPLDYYENAREFRSKLIRLHYDISDILIPAYSQMGYIDDICFAIRAEKSKAISTWERIASKLFPSRFGLNLKLTGEGHKVSFLDVAIDTSKGILSL